MRDLLIGVAIGVLTLGTLWAWFHWTLERGKKDSEDDLVK